MITPENFTLLTIIIYFCASAAGLCGMCLRRHFLCRLGCWLALAAFFCQTVILIFGFHKSLTHGLSLGAYLQMLAWFFLLCGIGAWWRLRQDVLLLFAAVLGFILFLMSAPWLHLTVALPGNLQTPFYTLHIGALFFSLGLLALAFVAALLFIFLEKRIKFKKNMKGFWQDMPALSILDKINAACVPAVFILYTIGILAGLFWAKPVFGSTINGDPKEIVSLFIWLLLALLFNNRIMRGWVGRKPAILTILIFILSCLSILIVNVFLPTHHNFMRN